MMMHYTKSGCIKLVVNLYHILMDTSTPSAPKSKAAHGNRALSAAGG